MIIKPHFSGHETFPLRWTWLKKGLDAVSEDPGTFGADDALVKLGVGKNMVRAIRHWCLATGVIEEGDGSRGKLMQPTEFGRSLLSDDGWDPYLEDPGTLWLLHWNLASRPGRATTWFWLFNLQSTADFTIDGVVQSLVRLAREREWPKLTPTSLRRDVDCCVRTYYSGRKTARAVLEDTLDCPLAELKLVRPAVTKGSYVLTREARTSLPAEVFAYALGEYLQARDATTAVGLDDLLYQPGAPGRVFGLDEQGLVRCIEEVSKRLRAVTYDETAGLKQVRLASRFNGRALLESMYDRRGAKTKRRVA